jgi:5'-3' exonuclease
MTTTILLVDLSAVFWRGWHATAEEAEGSAAQRITLSMIRQRAQGYDHVAICIDSPKSWRRDLEPTYKANREAKPKGALDQLKRCQGILQADGYPILGADGYEADDVIATSVAWLVDAVEGEYNIGIYSGDKDLLACLQPGVERISMATGEVVTADDVYRKLGVEPSEIPDWLALMGDASDNIRGVHRVGSKVAAKLVAEHGSVQGVIDAVTANPDQFTPALQANLLDARAWLPMSLRLSTLNADAPINCAAILQPRTMQPLCGGGMSLDEMTDDERHQYEHDKPSVVSAEPSQPERGSDPGEAREVAIAEPEPVDPKRVERAMALRAPDWDSRLEPTSLVQLYKLAENAHNSRLFSAFGNADALFVVALAGHDLGLRPIKAMLSMHVIKNRAVLPAQLLMALCLKNPACEYFMLVESSSESATYETKRRENPRENTLTWTLDDAKRAGLLGKDNWRHHPADMLRNRAMAALARAVYPDSCHNVYVEGEL